MIGVQEIKSIVYIINGKPESGKTTFEKLCKNWLELNNKYAYILSTIDPIKKIAKEAGWNGEKTPRDRKYLSDLKDILTEWLDYSYNYMANTMRSFCMANMGAMCESKNVIFFIDCREPQEIQKFKERCGATTVLVQRPGHDTEISNHADADVNNFIYDYYIQNDGDLDKLSQTAHTFLKEVNLI